jgi:hypothetical protein
VSRVVTLDVPLDYMRAAAKAAGGSVNDVSLAAISAALWIYHGQMGLATNRLPWPYQRASVPKVTAREAIILRIDAVSAP